MKKKSNGRRYLSDILKRELKNPRVRKSYEEAAVSANVAMAVANLRKKVAMSQKELAAKVGVTQQVISRLEDPTRSNMTLATLSKVASALGKHLNVGFQ